MSAFDLTILIILAVFTFLGIYWGLIRQVLAVVGLLVGVVVAGRYGPVVAGWLSSFVSSESLAGALGFVAVLLLVSALASLAASLLRLFAGLLFLGWLDHLLGGLLGLLQGAIAAAVFVVVAVTFQVDSWQGALQNSQIVGVLLGISGALTALLPPEFREAVRGFVGR